MAFKTEQLAWALNTTTERQGAVMVGEYAFGFTNGTFGYDKSGEGGELLPADCTLEQMVSAVHAVTKLHELGYRVEGTGGGCTCWLKRIDLGEILITQWGDPSVPLTMSEPVRVGIYDKHGDCVVTCQTTIESLPTFEDGQRI